MLISILTFSRCSLIPRLHKEAGYKSAFVLSASMIDACSIKVRHAIHVGFLADFHRYHLVTPHRTKFVFRQGSAPEPAGGTHDAPPDL